MSVPDKRCFILFLSFNQINDDDDDDDDAINNLSDKVFPETETFLGCVHICL